VGKRGTGRSRGKGQLITQYVYHTIGLSDNYYRVCLSYIRVMNAVTTTSEYI